MAIDDIFYITGKGTIVTGKVDRGTLKSGDEVEIVGFSSENKKVTVAGIEMFNETIESAEPGDVVGVILSNVGKDEIKVGQVISKPDSIYSHTEFEAEIYVLSEEEGGINAPLVKGNNKKLYFRTTYVQGNIELLDEKESIMPGDNATINVKLTSPIAIEEGTEFAIFENNKIIGSGIVSEIMK